MISPLAVVSSKATLGKNVSIGPFTVVHDDVVIGDNTKIENSVTIFDGARIGAGCHIFPGAVISAVPQDLKYAGEITFAEIGDNTIIREFVTVNKGTIAAGKTVLGKNNLLMAYTHVAHDCMIGNHCILANGVTLAGHITIDDYAIIGGLCAVHQFVHIGSHVMISGGSLVRKDVPPYTSSAHEPLAYIGVNSVGLRRRGFTNEEIAEIQNIYRYIFVENHTVPKALEMVEAQFAAGPHRNHIVDFIRKATRGIMKGYMPQLDN